MTTLTVADLGLPEVSVSSLSPDHAQRVAALLDRPSALAAGDPLPLPWHWAFFTPVTPQGELGLDGHPRVAPGGATRGFPRRMFAGGRLLAHGSLVLGEPTERATRVLTAARKDGRSGALLLITVEHVYSQRGIRILEEENDIVYRADGGTVAEPTGAEVPEAPEGGFVAPVDPDPTLLFRYSAVTFNAHRIHYDEAYATGVEGYPALVVHGPLTATLLAAAAAEHLGRPLRGFEFRATAPLFVTHRFYLVGQPAGDGLDLRAARQDGQTAMQAAAG